MSDARWWPRPSWGRLCLHSGICVGKAWSRATRARHPGSCLANGHHCRRNAVKTPPHPPMSHRGTLQDRAAPGGAWERSRCSPRFVQLQQLLTPQTRVVKGRCRCRNQHGGQVTASCGIIAELAAVAWAGRRCCPVTAVAVGRPLGHAPRVSGFGHVHVAVLPTLQHKTREQKKAMLGGSRRSWWVPAKSGTCACLQIWTSWTVITYRRQGVAQLA